MSGEHSFALAKSIYAAYGGIGGSMIRAGKILGGASLLAIAATAAAAGTAAAQQQAGYSSYIAFGDSYSSGVGATTWKAGDLCIRSDSAWTALVDGSIGNPPFAHAACSGATAQDILAQGPKYEQQGRISQVALLPPADQLKGALITVQVGGNDLRHESECISGIKLLNGQHGPIPEACKDVEYAANNLFETVANLATELDYLYQNLRALAPEATIVAVGYPHIIDANSPNCSLDAFPGVTPALKQAFNALVDAGNAQIKQTAGNLGITAITDEIATRFAGHEVCSADEWIVSLEQLRSLEPHEITRGGHPNDVGHQMIADVVLTYLPTVTANNGTVIPEGGGEVGEPGTEGGEIGEPGTEGGEVGEPGTEGGEIGEPGTEGGEVGEPGTEGGEEGECQTTSKIEGQQIGRGSL